MMATLVVACTSFALYSTVDIFETTPINGDSGLVHPVHRATMNTHEPMHSLPRSKKDHRPRVLTLELGQLAAIRNENYPRVGSNSFLVGLEEIPEYVSTMTENDSAIEDDNSAETEPLAPTNSSVTESPPPPEVDTRVEKQCLPMAKWMTASYPNCNSIHEIDMEHSVSSITYQDEEDLKFLGQGWFRDTWQYVNENFEDYPPVVIKTLRIEREFLDEYFDLHRRDAVAMERLTFSPYVVNVHGHCGQSAINELAEGILGGQIRNLEQLDRKLRGKEKDPNVLHLKLRLASKVSLGLAHVHNIHVSDNSGGRSRSIQSLLYEHTNPNSTHSTTGFGRSVATMAHYDVSTAAQRERDVWTRTISLLPAFSHKKISAPNAFDARRSANRNHQINPRNIAIMRDGNPKLNDFNIAEFMTYDVATNQTCGFRSRLHEPWWRAPEEMDTSHTAMVDEKVDVYALGEVLFHILTTHGPRGKMKKFRMEEVREIVRNGKPPTMWEPYKSDPAMKSNPVVKAFMKALDLCFEPDPTKRGTSIQVARVLHKALMKEDERRSKKQKE